MLSSGADEPTKWGAIPLRAAALSAYWRNTLTDLTDSSLGRTITSGSNSIVASPKTQFVVATCLAAASLVAAVLAIPGIIDDDPTPPPVTSVAPAPPPAPVVTGTTPAAPSTTVAPAVRRSETLKVTHGTTIDLDADANENPQWVPPSPSKQEISTNGASFRISKAIAVDAAPTYDACRTAGVYNQVYPYFPDLTSGMKFCAITDEKRYAGVEIVSIDRPNGNYHYDTQTVRLEVWEPKTAR